MKLRENPTLKSSRAGRRNVVCLNPECHQVQSGSTTSCPRCGGTWVYVTRSPGPSRKHATRFKAFLRWVSRTHAYWQGDKLYPRQRCCREPVKSKPLAKHEREFTPRQLKPRRQAQRRDERRSVPSARDMILEGLEG